MSKTPGDDKVSRAFLSGAPDAEKTERFSVPNSDNINLQNVEELFFRAMECAPGERTVQLHAWCDGDTALEEQVLALIEADSQVEKLISAAPVMREDVLLRDEERVDEDALLGRVVGAFRLERLLGRGGMGVVYLGQRVSGGFAQTVAVKLVGWHLRSSPAVAQFLVERETLAKLEHKNIARLVDGGVTSEGFPYVAMEYVEGRRLDEACDDPTTTPGQIIRWMLQLCDAVGYVHRNLILHRDLKPGNVMVTAEGQVKLLDFGTLKRMGPESDTDSEMTRAGMRPVTVRYASPEHIEGASVSTAADVYSLGMMLYRLIAGRLPEGLDDLPIGHYLARLKGARFKAPSLVASESGVRRFNTTMARDLDAIVMRALRYEPQARYPTADALANDLWNVLLHRPVTAREGNVRYRAGKFYRRYRWPILASAAAFVVLVAGVCGMAWQGHVARIEQLRAEKGVEDERALAHMLLFDYFEELSLVPGSVEAQRKAVTQALAYLDGLAQIASGSDLELDTIEGYKDMGDLLGNPYQQNLGNVPDAEKSMEKALALAKARMQRYPHDLPTMRALEETESQYGGLVLGNGDAVRAEKYLIDGAAIAARIAADPKVTGPLLENGASVTDLLGDVYDPGRGYATANLEKAVATYTLSDDYDRQCSRIDPGNALCQIGLIVGQYKVGMIIEDTDPEAAADHYRQAMLVVHRFTPEEMKTTRSQRMKNYPLSRLALMEMATGHMAQGITDAHEVQEGFRIAIAKAELDNRARFDLVAFDTDLLDMYDRYGHEKEAEETAREVLQALDVLLRRSPKNVRWQMIQAQDLIAAGRVEAKLGHRQEAQEQSRVGVAQAAKLAENKEASPEVLVLAAEGLLDQGPAREEAKQALGFAQRAVAAYAKPTAEQLLTLAKAEKAVGEPKAADKEARRALQAMAGPVKSRTVALRVAEARRLLQ